MLKEAIEYILKLKRPETLKVGERDFATLDLYPIMEAECSALEVFNLDSLIQYIKNNPDNNIDKIKIINIESPLRVVAESNLFGNFKQREKFVIVDYSDLIPSINFGRYMNIEEFIIMLKSKFIVTEDLEKLIKVVGNITDENVTNYNDDGITQKVTTKTGIARVGEVALPPRIKLKPYRTFVEVEQPESEFLLRAKKGYDGIEFALFEADGGAWKKQAINNVADYLKENLSNENITILN